MTETLTVEPALRVHFGFERKLGLPNYSSKTASANVSADLSVDADQTEVIAKIQSLAAAVKLAVLAELGVAAEFGADGTVVEVEAAPAVTLSVADAKAKLENAFSGPPVGATSDAPQGGGERTGYASGGGSTVRVAGAQHGDLPAWLIEAAAKAGVTKVFDNRDKAIGTKRPWFVNPDNRDQAFWPPKS